MKQAALFAMAMIAAGCLDDRTHDNETRECPLVEHEPVAPTGAVHQYVVDSVHLPDSATESYEIGFDVDGDPQGRPDNALGSVLAMICHHLDVDMELEIAKLIQAGDILHLIEVRATDLADARGVEVTIAHGIDFDEDPWDNFSGTEVFRVKRSRGQGAVSGTIEQGRLVTTGGTVPLAVTFPGFGDPFILPLSFTHIDATIDENGISGRIGGAITYEAVRRDFLPVLVEGLSRVIARDCMGTVCWEGSSGELILDLLDEDLDGAVTVDELLANDLISSLFSPDLDLFDDEGALALRCDEVRDSLSIAIEFSATRATIDWGPAAMDAQRTVSP